MVPESLLELFDAQVRPPGVVSGDGWSMVTRPPEGGDVEGLLAHLRERPGYREWKYYEHDGPELAERLRAAGLEPPPGDVELRLATDEFVELAAGVFGRRSSLPSVAVAVLFGGVTLPAHRGRGLYRATVARRAELARERGYRWLYVDALPTSRPILERLGFVAITTTTPFVIPAAAR